MTSSSIIKPIYRTKCDCGDQLQYSVSRNDKNSGRKFKACPNYKLLNEDFVCKVPKKGVNISNGLTHTSWSFMLMKGNPITKLLSMVYCRHYSKSSCCKDVVGLLFWFDVRTSWLIVDFGM
uniref:Zinc finger GRF-type domain-containing protein n=1 Tax=Lactuca sativa TaxID=4236 RepID=A0A9R1V3Y0_LACSA|nr:hypothetical protein LSAT_V11C700349690 [Lactuca sativa]